MKISNSRLKIMIRESLLSLLSEGVQDTVARATGLTDPKKIDNLRIASEKPHKLQKPDLLWIAKYYMTPEGANSKEPIEDIVLTIKDFKKSKARIQKVGQSVNINDYDSPVKLAVTSNYSEGYLHNSVLEQEAQKIYHTSEWQIWMPITREASCTLGSGTSWCTALRSKGNNLFYNYIMREDVILYYVIYVGKREIDKSISKMALGVVDGKVAFAEKEGQGHGGITVDLGNNGVTMQRFISVVNSNAKKPIGQILIQEIENHVKGLGDQHPAMTKMKELITNPLKLKNENRGKSKEVVMDFVKVMLEYAEAHDIRIIDETLAVIKDLITITEKDVLKLQQLEMHKKCVDLKKDLNLILNLLDELQSSELVNSNWQKMIGPCIDKNAEKLIYISVPGFLYQAFYTFFEDIAKSNGFKDLETYTQREDRDDGDMSFADISGDVMYEHDDITEFIFSLDSYTQRQIAEDFISRLSHIDIFVYATGYQREDEADPPLFGNEENYEMLV